MRLFFYGTLLDPDVQALVLGRTLARELTPACLRHFRRVYIAGQAYPMILPHRGGAVDGAITTHLSKEDLARITVYEGDDYRMERHGVFPIGEDQQPSARPVFAWLYRSRPPARPSTRAWQLSAWQMREKASYLRDTREWLANQLLRQQG